MKHPLEKMYPSMFKTPAPKQQAATKAERMYPSMVGVQEANAQREAGWRRAQPEHLTLARMYPTMLARYDIVLDDPNNVEQGAWIRTRAVNEGESHEV